MRVLGGQGRVVLGEGCCVCGAAMLLQLNGVFGAGQMAQKAADVYSDPGSRRPSTTTQPNTRRRLTPILTGHLQYPHAPLAGCS